MSEDEKELSLEEELSAVYDELSGDDEDEIIEIESEDSSEEEDVEEIPEEDEGEEGIEEEDISEDEEELEPLAASEEDEEYYDAPASWKKEEREKWDELPKWAQGEILRREQDRDRHLHEKSQQFSEYNRQVEPILSKLAPYHEYFALRGISPADIIERAIIIDQRLARGENPLGDFQGDTVQSTEGQLPDDPRIRELTQKVNHLEAQGAQQDEAAVLAMQTSVNDAIGAFVTATDENGNVAHPYFEEVRVDMKHLVQYLGQQPENANMPVDALLQEAYNRAVRANPETFAKMQQDEARKAKHAQLQDAKKRAKEAKRKSRPASRGSKKTSPAPAKYRSVEDEVRAVWDELAS